MKNWYKSIHCWCLHWATTKWGDWALFVCAFADASFFPLPTPMLFLTLSLMNVRKTYKYALYGTLGLLSGAIVGYSCGHFAWLEANGDFAGLAQFMFDHIPGFSEEGYNYIRFQIEKWGLGIFFVASFMPLPYNIFSISAGVFDVNIFIFCMATLIGQGLRFFLMALFIEKFGTNVIHFFEYVKKPVALLVTVCLLAAIVVIKVF